MFRSRNLEDVLCYQLLGLPCCHAHTVLQELGPNYVAVRDKSYSTTSSVLPPVEQNGWSIEKGGYSCAKSHFAGTSRLEQSLNLPNVRANQMQRKVQLQQQE